MKASFVALLGLQALIAAAGPAVSLSSTPSLNSHTPTNVTKSPAEAMKTRFTDMTMKDEGPLTKRACNYPNCDSCWAKYSYCIQCSGPRATPASCVSW